MFNLGSTAFLVLDEGGTLDERETIDVCFVALSATTPRIRPETKELLADSKRFTGADAPCSLLLAIVGCVDLMSTN